jgi:hypothetical protein
LSRAVRECASDHCCSYVTAQTGKQRLEQRREGVAVAYEHPEEASPS